MHTFNILLGQQQLKSWLDHGWITNFTLRCWTIKRPATGHKQNPYTLRQWLPDMPTTMPVFHFATIMVSKFCYGDNRLPIAPGHTWTHLNPFETTCHQLDAELDPDLQLRLSPTLWSGCLDWSPGPNCGSTTHPLDVVWTIVYSGARLKVFEVKQDGYVPAIEADLPDSVVFTMFTIWYLPLSHGDLGNARDMPQWTSIK